jgi:lipopolysaccharide export system protein LptC
MRLRRPRAGLLLGLAVAALAALSWWLARDVERAHRLSGGPRDSREIDYYLRTLDFSTFSEQGELARTLKSPELRHYADDDSTELDRPHLTIYKNDAPPWRVRSDTGWVSPDGKLVKLHGDVLIERDAGRDIRPMRIVTRSMRVEPERDYAETDEPVTVTSLNDRIDSVGMQAWLREPGRIKFLSQVRGHYAAPQ